MIFLMKKDNVNPPETYWTMMDIWGEIHPIPATLSKILEANKDADATSIKTYDGKFQLLLTNGN